MAAMKTFVLIYNIFPLGLVCTLFVDKIICREVFADFDPVAISKLNERKMTAPGTAASSLLSELKLRAIIENACQVTKVYYYFS